MKYFYRILISFALLFLCQTPALARENVTNWYIKDLKTEIRVNQDSSLDITENILADCGDLPDKHGIFRVLPKNYRTKNGNFNLPIKLISITNGLGRSLKYSVSSNNDTVAYKIGDPNIDVSGENSYIIKYHIKNAVRTENNNFDELYWNVLGNFWNLEIDSFSAFIIFPKGINSSNTEISYYTGDLNSKGSNLAVYEWGSDGALNMYSNQTLLRNQGITLSATFPKNIIKPYQPTFEDKYGFSIFDIFLFLFFPILIFILCFYFSKKNSNHFDFKKTVVPEFEIPENLVPIEMGGVIKKGKLDKNSIAATVIHLGVLGYLKIERTTEKILFVDASEVKLINTEKPIGPDLNELEKYILAAILGSTKEVKLENVSLTVSSHFMQISGKLLATLRNKDFINTGFDKYKELIFLGVICFIGIFFVIALNLSLSFLVSLIISFVIVLGFSGAISNLTYKGAEINWRIKGFRLYMETAEKYRSRFQEQNDILDKLLPYAILFGITKEWLSKLNDIYGEEYMNNYSPSFMSGNIGLIGFGGLLSTISSVSDSVSNGVASAMTGGDTESSSMSGFGGFGGSGGGGGGGGGGGW